MKILVLCAAFFSSALFAQNAPAKKAEPAPNSPEQLGAAKPLKKAEPASVKKTEPLVSAKPVVPVLPALTFQPFKVEPSAASTNFEFRTYLEPAQAPFKVSLIGVNINSWLENPDSYQTLADAAENFPVESLLANLSRYNPALTFNSPALVKELLGLDIYAPYLKNLEKQPKMPPSFTARKGAVSFTRNYHIYGASAAGLPYFGVPAEGADRGINLAVLKGQIQEYAARLPDTDIFLAAVINITPNWLEEGWDVRQVNRQNASILVYAFNRKGRLIGAAGAGQNFFTKEAFISLPQALQSTTWQPSVPRIFYIWPSFKIINTPVAGSEKQSPAGALPPSARPYLNSTQKYILACMNNIRTLNRDPSTPIFDDSGRKIYSPEKAPADKRVFLARRKIYLTNSPVLAKPELHYPARALSELDGSAPRSPFREIKLPLKETEEQKTEKALLPKKEAKTQKKEKVSPPKKDPVKAALNLHEAGRLSSLPLTFKAQKANKELSKPGLADNKITPNLGELEDKLAEKRSQKDEKERISVSEGIRMRKYYPSNEKEKIRELIGALPSYLKGIPFYTTNDMLAISNSIPAYEMESDPAAYHSERKKYFSVKASAKIFARQYKKDSALYKKALTARMNDEIYWAALHKKALQDNNLWTPELEQGYRLYAQQLAARKKMELARFDYDRDTEFAKTIAEQSVIFGKRELDNLQKKIKKPEVMAAKVAWNQENVGKATLKYTQHMNKEAYLQKQAEFQKNYLASAKELDIVYAQYKKLLPSNLQVSFLNSTAGDPVQMLNENRLSWSALAERNRVPLEMIAYVEINHYLYPSKRFLLSLERKALRQYKKDMRFLSYEGFMLGLSGGWKLKTYASDRTVGL